MEEPDQSDRGAMPPPLPPRQRRLPDLVGVAGLQHSAARCSTPRSEVTGEPSALMDLSSCTMSTIDGNSSIPQDGDTNNSALCCPTCDGVWSTTSEDVASYVHHIFGWASSQPGSLGLIGDLSTSKLRRFYSPVQYIIGRTLKEGFALALKTTQRYKDYPLGYSHEERRPREFSTKMADSLKRTQATCPICGIQFDNGLEEHLRGHPSLDTLVGYLSLKGCVRNPPPLAECSSCGSACTPSLYFSCTNHCGKLARTLVAAVKANGGPPTLPNETAAFTTAQKCDICGSDQPTVKLSDTSSCVCLRCIAGIRSSLASNPKEEYFRGLISKIKTACEKALLQAISSKGRRGRSQLWACLVSKSGTDLTRPTKIKTSDLDCWLGPTLSSPQRCQELLALYQGTDPMATLDASGFEASNVRSSIWQVRQKN